MLRRLLLYLSAAGWARHIVTHWRLAGRMARRFVAGETLDEAIAVIRTLNSKGILVTLDQLGESITSAEDARQVAQTYCAVLDRLHAENLHRTSISLKLTHLGLAIDEGLCFDNLQHILSRAKTHGFAVTIDMESSAYTDTTLRLYRRLRDEHGFANVGTVIQAYLYRSADDLRQLAAEGAHIRLCKGAYFEPPEVAFPQKADVDASYKQLAAAYLLAPPPAYLCIATHDEAMIRAAEDVIRQHDIPADRYEFQMLYGVRSERQIELTHAGYKMRVYVPYGAAWYPYFMRRLAERPANLWFILRNLFRR